ncbi:MAG: bifunctional pyr operon transcriptional regulator/uracil phosphoribosyltransferase PyrR [Deltaproteobacteria bacterium]|nr:bifunctional pyr operon transcriptional regulator/uracil phosphoribosyltransferase PyrR [Deltaproteobacteria bacterium]
MTQEKQILFEADELARTIGRMGHEMVEKVDDPHGLVLIGIRSRGVHLARRIAGKIMEIAKYFPPVAVLDVTAYRDDRAREPGSAEIGDFEVPVAVDNKTVVLIDDVIFRGRTIRAAMEAVARLGQPKKILVAALVDRGSRELPIRADIVGKNLEAGAEDRVNVMLEESDGIDQIAIARWQGRGVV